MLKKYIWVVCTVLYIIPAWGADFVTGFNAYKQQDYKTALENWQPLAQQGNANAHYSLGVMYRFGNGVPQDYVLAHMWFNILAYNGYDMGQQMWDTLAKIMTAEQIRLAQSMAFTCLSSGYKQCGY